MLLDSSTSGISVKKCIEEAVETTFGYFMTRWEEKFTGRF
jgi:hypothetical protein